MTITAPSPSSASLLGRRPRRALAIAVMWALVPACGDLDETDADPPSVKAVSVWDASHLVALRTYYKQPVLLDGATGRKTATLGADKYYEDLAPIGDGEYIGLHHQSIDFLTAAGQVDAARSITGDLFGHMALSADRSVLAFSEGLDPTTSTIGIIALDGNARSSLPGLSFNLTQSLSLSRDGALVAFATGDVVVARTRTTDAAAAVPPSTTCVLEGSLAGALATAFSPVADTLAVSKGDGSLSVFDLGHYPECRLLTSVPPPSPDGASTQSWYLQYSPDGTRLAVSLETSTAQASGIPFSMTGVVRILDAVDGVMVTELSVYQWERTSPPPASAPLITDLQWSAAGDRLVVSTSDGPLRQWDVAGTLLWSTKL